MANKDRRTKADLLQEIEDLKSQVDALEDGADKAMEANQAVMNVLKSENQNAKILEAQKTAAERVIQEYRWLARMLAGGEFPFHLKPIQDVNKKKDLEINAR